jgi:hypothetical protein
MRGRPTPLPPFQVVPIVAPDLNAIKRNGVIDSGFPMGSYQESTFSVICKKNSPRSRYLFFPLE